MEFSPEQKKVIASRGRNLLVSAAAGSGKTAVLVERVLALITDPDAPVDLDRILIVTFTEAAAGEMKERLARELERRILEEPDSEHLKRQAVLIHHAQINTIHSFCSYIIRNYFFRTGIDPTFRVMEEGESRLMISDVMSEMLEEKYQEAGEEFTGLVTNYFAQKSDEGLEDVIETLFLTAQTMPWPKKWFEGAAERYDEEKIPEYCDTEEEIAQQRYTAPYVRELIALASEFTERFNSRKREKNVCDFADLEHLALEILHEEDDTGEMVRSDAAKELASRYKYIMTDEYQDSILIQESLLYAVSGNADGICNRFMVGDIKQSIYGFRQARPDLFQDKFDSYVKEENADRCERIDLNTNYRSRREVIDTVNGFFEKLMTRELGGVDYDKSSRLNYGGLYPEEEETGKYETEFIVMDRKSPDMEEFDSSAGSRRIEALLAGNKIKEIVGKLPVYDKEAGGYRPCRYSDIAVLFQVQSGVSEVFQREFTALGIPSNSVSKTGYFSATEIKTVLNYLSILDNPHQDIPFAGVLFSPIAGVSANELGKIRAAVPEGDYYSACLEYVQKGTDETLCRKLQAFLESYEKLRAMVPCTPVHELVEKVYRETGYLDIASAMPAGEQRAANLYILRNKAVKFEETSYHGVFNFIRYIEKMKKYSMDDGEVNIFSETADTVRLMSIHKSKGLEFPVVFLCDTTHKFNKNDLKGSFAFHSDLGIAMDVLDAAAHKKVAGIAKQKIADRKLKDLYSEKIRVLYVALTRAKEKLYITGIPSDLEKLKEKCRTAALSEKGTIDPGFLLNQDNLLVWLMTALCGEPPGHLKFRIETPSSLMSGITRSEIRENELLEKLRAIDNETVYDPEIIKRTEEIDRFEYPFANREGMPGKMTVSQLKLLGGAEEEEPGELLEKEPPVVPYIPQFVSGKPEEKLSGAARGTLYHKIFERIDYTAIPDDAPETAMQYMKKLVSGLREKGFLNENECSSIAPEDFVNFLASETGIRMKKAAEKGCLYREQAFTFSIPAQEADASWPADEPLLVQGIIDAYFEEDGEYVIVDYKTDHTDEPDGSGLVDKYRKQVYYYARALEAASGKRVKEGYLYSTCLSREFRVR